MSEQANAAQHAAIKTEARGNWALTMLARSTVDSHRVVFRLVNDCNKEMAVGSKRARKSGKGLKTQHGQKVQEPGRRGVKERVTHCRPC